MAGGEYEPEDSRKVVGTKGNPDKSWHEGEGPKTEHSEYAPADQRNVTGQADTESDRWRKAGKRPPLASGETPEDEDGDQRD